MSTNCVFNKFIEYWEFIGCQVEAENPKDTPVWLVKESPKPS